MQEGKACARNVSVVQRGICTMGAVKQYQNTQDLSYCDTFYIVLLHGSVNACAQPNGNNHKHCLLQKTMREEE